MTGGDHALLEAVSAALNAAPFSGVIVVHGQPMSRELARAIERHLLRQRVSERRRVMA